MLINTNIEPIAGVYHAMIFTLDPTQPVIQAINQFGEPAVDVGGSYSGSYTPAGSATPVALAFSFPPSLRRILTDFPVKQLFPLSASSNAQAEAQLYTTTIAANINLAVNALVGASGITGNNPPGAAWRQPFFDTAPIPANQDYVAITGLALPFTPVGCIVTVLMPQGGGIISATPDASTLSSDGVTAYLSTATPNGNYIASYIFF
jgi:hypothetical protein